MSLLRESGFTREELIDFLAGQMTPDAVFAGWVRSVRTRPKKSDVLGRIFRTLFVLTIHDYYVIMNYKTVGHDYRPRHHAPSHRQSC